MSAGQKPSVGRVVHFYPGGPYPLRQDEQYDIYWEPTECERPLCADVIDTRAEEPNLPDDMTVHLYVKGSMAYATMLAKEVPYSETPTPGAHRWCWPPRT